MPQLTIGTIEKRRLSQRRTGSDRILPLHVHPPTSSVDHKRSAGPPALSEQDVVPPAELDPPEARRLSPPAPTAAVDSARTGTPPERHQLPRDRAPPPLSQQDSTTQIGSLQRAPLEGGAGGSDITRVGALQKISLPKAMPAASAPVLKRKQVDGGKAPGRHDFFRMRLRIENCSHVFIGAKEKFCFRKA